MMAERRVLHLSDLHFGRTRPDLVDPLLEMVHEVQPHVVAISGDFTQRARTSQFREARAFIDRIAVPVVAVPGNHDVPLGNLGARLLTPFRAYRQWIDHDLEPVHCDDALAVIGMNTADPLAWQRGRVRPVSLERTCRHLREAGPERARIVVAHHPFEHLPGERKELMPGAETALRRLSACGAHIVLTGHLHAWRAAPFTLPEGHEGVLQIQAGTGLSTRLRGEANDFNLITIDGDCVRVERFVAESDTVAFTRLAALDFRRVNGAWESPEPAEAPGRAAEEGQSPAPAPASALRKAGSSRRAEGSSRRQGDRARGSTRRR
jgi:3',5'-cyclic AMP phosphodiesterase CpdA